ncbi:MAG TPA: cyclase family protein [Pyrinomonadaceae bacterium]|jgi:kynurenine formamidase|nr:cyclase family protein [Pyrinomonadaceae bacterium]
MIISIEINGVTKNIDLSNPIDLAIPLNFNGPQPSAYGAERAVSKPCEAGSLVGDTRQGGSCNFEQYTFIPHCNGTHTESIGHITKERITILGSLKDAFVPAILISVEPESAAETTDTYAPEKGPDDRLITRAGLENALKGPPPGSAGHAALIVRTLPNDDSKKTRDYMKEPAPFFSLEAIAYVAELGFEHLLVDLPSIDRAFDEGLLSAHRVFWNIREKSQETDKESRIHRTVTEMIYVPNETEDGPYLLNLQIAPFAADAAPSRPLLFRYATK